MINIQKQVAYWRNGASEDWQVATELVRRKRLRHGFFFAHLALEEALKAHVCYHTKDLAPRMHNW
jgi:HEPN domain-containing protein